MDHHVAVFPWPYTSHPFALFNLTCKLASAAPQVKFSFLNAATTNRQILSQRNYDLPLNVKTYDVEDGIPKDHEGPTSPQEEASFYVRVMPDNFIKGMDIAVKKSGNPITFLFTDALFSSVVGKMAVDMNVPWAAFWVAAPHALAAFYYADLVQQFYSNIKGVELEPEDQALTIIPGLSALRIRDLSEEILPRNCKSYPDSSPVIPMMHKMGGMLPKASAVVMNSYDEMNPAQLTKDLKSKFQKLLDVGFLTVPIPLPPPTGEDPTLCLSWLDGQKLSSVIYVSFGTLLLLSEEELGALAEALEASGHPFLWSLKDSFRDHLPNGFLERTRIRGKVVSWAPQTRILAHPSVGAHVSHAGYNSICESILGAVPMICRSVWADNHMNARMVEEVWGIGVRVDGGVITKIGMLKCLESVVNQERGKKMREAIGALKESILRAAGPDGIADADFKTLVRVISQHN